MSTVYTLNGKVLKNSANDKWLIKKEAPTIEEVTIGSQTWMNTNLAIDDGGVGIVRKDNVTANGVNFGSQYYYTHDAAVRVAASMSGYHLPTLDEWWLGLITFVGDDAAGAKKLNSISGWDDNSNGTDEYGFNSLPVGYVDEQGIAVSTGRLAYFWSTNNNTFIGGDSFNIGYGISGYGMLTPMPNQYYSVRLIKDS